MISKTIYRGVKDIKDIIDQNINYYNLEINKIDSESQVPLPGVEFELKYTTQYGEEKAEKYVNRSCKLQV